MRYAVYRVLYGEDFVQESIRSIEPYVDKIFVFYATKPFGGFTTCQYKGSTMVVPPKIDGILDAIMDLKCDKVVLQHHFNSDPHNQLTDLVNNHLLPICKKPDTLIFMEPDHVWDTAQIEQALKEFDLCPYTCASSRQVELWKKPNYRIPERVGRVGSVFWNMGKIECLPNTRPNGIGDGFGFLNAHVHNFGFCFSPHTMFWKHVLAVNFSRAIGDSEPNEDWFDQKWMSWDINTNNSNLEMARGHESTIPYATSYNTMELPQLIIKKFGYEKDSE